MVLEAWLGLSAAIDRQTRMEGARAGVVRGLDLHEASPPGLNRLPHTTLQALLAYIDKNCNLRPGVPMSLLDRVPTEILTLCLAYLDSHDLATMLSICSTLRAVASQDILWEPHCDRIYNTGSSDILGWRPIRALDLCNAHNKLSYHLIWRRLALVEPYLGWWLSLDEFPAGIVMRIWIDNQKLIVSHIIPVTGPNTTTTPQVLAIRNALDHIFALSSHNDLLNPLFIDAQSIVLEQWSTKQSVQWLFEGPSRIMDRKYMLQSFHASNMPTDETSVPTLQHQSQRVQLYSWKFRNSPSLFHAIRHSGVTFDELGYATALSVPTLSFPRSLSPRPFVAIRSPFEESGPSPLIASGTWVASYGEAHGCEFIHVHIREIDERDINGQWGEEQSLASAMTPDAQDVQSLFHMATTPSSILTSEDVRVGNTIIEAIKITGDVNVPRGVRTFVGFIDHKNTWSGPSHEGDFLPRPTSHPWPLSPGSAIQRGTPASALPASLGAMKEQDIPTRGMTMPGIMRVSETGFLDPKWANATVHISNRREIRVMLQDGHHVTTFYKADKSMFELIR